MYFPIQILSLLLALSPAEISMQRALSKDTINPPLIENTVKPSGSVQKRPISPKKLSIQEILDNGSVIVLTDGSVWKVAIDDTDFTSGWLGPAPVQIKKEEEEDGSYSYYMTNTWTNKTVKVAPII
jgi:hypothetical protein